MKGILKSRDAGIAALIALATLLLYALTLAPDIVDGDGGEFQFAAWNFAFAHPTGYPLYLLLGGMFQHLLSFVSTPAYWLNFFTALTAALAVAILYLTLHSLTASRGAAIVAAVAFALTRQFWHDAGAAEVYALHIFFVALLLALALRWQVEPSAEKFAWFCFTLGLALTHHRSIILWLPAFALFFVLTTRTRRYATTGHHVLRNALLFLAPLLLYLYIPLRAPASPYFALTLAPDQNFFLYDHSLNGFIDYVLGTVFQTELRFDAVSVARLAAFPQMLIEQFNWYGIGLGVAGLIAMVWRKDNGRLALFLGGAGTNLLFAAVYHIGDIASYYLPIYFVFTIFIGVGLAGALQGAQDIARHSSRGAFRSSAYYSRSLSCRSTNSRQIFLSRIAITRRTRAARGFAISIRPCRATRF